MAWRGDTGEAPARGARTSPDTRYRHDRFGSAGEAVWYALNLLPILILGAFSLPTPFHGDQATFFLGASMMAESGVLYVDFWDCKQPAIFAFYFAAISLFGNSALAVHALELAWMSILAISIMVLLRRYYRHRWLSAPAAVAVVATYYAHAGFWELAQIEALVLLPIFLSLWLVSNDRAAERQAVWGAFLAGVLAAVTVCFKLVFAPLFVVFWTVASATRLRRGASTPKDEILRLWLPATIGVTATLALVAGIFWAAGGLEEMLWASFVFPLAALDAGTGGASIARLANALIWYGAAFAPWLLFVGLAIFFPRDSRPNLLSVQLFAWLATGMSVILLQTLSWWQYHMPLLFCATGILALRGLDGVLTDLRSALPDHRRAFGLVLAAVFLLPALGALAVPAKQKVGDLRDAFFVEDSGLEGLQDKLNPAYPTLRESARFLHEPQALPGPIYVFGNPLVYAFADRTQAIPIHGWAWEVMLPEQWRTLPEILGEAQPAYIFLDDSNHRLVARRAPETLALLQERYREHQRDESGRWYELVVEGEG